MTDEQLTTLKDQFDAYAATCNAALRLTLARIENLSEAILHTEGRSPFSSVKSRIKTFDSTMEKVGRKNIDANIDDIKRRIRDVAGIRIVTIFRDDIYRVADLIVKTPGINVVDKKDYIKEPKENGYSSLHLLVQVEIYVPQIGSELVPIEVQIRDKAMDTWASIEHEVKYKKTASPELEEKFRLIAEALSEISNMAMELRDSSL